MNAVLNQQSVKNKAIELAFAARTVIQQLATRDRTAEGLEAARILEDALTTAIPDVRLPQAKQSEPAHA